MLSKYETGKTVPSAEVLLRLREFAVEKEVEVVTQAIRDRVAGGDPEARKLHELWAKNWEGGEFLLGVTPQSTYHEWPDRTVTAFKALSAELLNRGKIPPELIELMALLVATRDNRAARPIMARISSYLDVELAVLGIKKSEVVTDLLRRIERPVEQTMFIYIKCPQTGKSVFTNSTATRRQFEATDYTHMSAKCPHCSFTHYWDKKDAYLQVEKPLGYVD
jgi:hypothetical protein